MSKYGMFGLAFRKSFLIAKGASPVYYWAANALARGRSRRAYLDDMVTNFHWLIDRLRAEFPVPAGTAALPEPRDRLERLFDFINQYVLCFLKPFDDRLSENDPLNFYMEREWRVAGGVAFRLDDLRRVIFPEAFAERFRGDVPGYFGQVQFPD